MTPATIIGIDPGAHGAIAVLDEGGDLLEAAFTVGAVASLRRRAARQRALAAAWTVTTQRGVAILSGEAAAALRIAAALDEAADELARDILALADGSGQLA